MHQITFSEWYERLKSPHYANNMQMYLAYESLNKKPAVKVSSFKHRASEIKEKYNYKFKTPQH